MTSNRRGIRLLEASLQRASASPSARTPAKTRKPIASRCSAQALPMPVEAPVITTPPGSVRFGGMYLA